MARSLRGYKIMSEIYNIVDKKKLDVVKNPLAKHMAFQTNVIQVKSTH